MLSLAALLPSLISRPPVMPSGFLSKFARDKSSPSGAKQQQQQQQQPPLRPSPRAPAPAPTTTTTTTSTAPAAPHHHSSIDSSASTPTVANSSAGGSGSSASSSLIAGRASQSALGQSRTLSTILGGEDFQRQEHQQQQPRGDAAAMSLQQNAVAEASAGVAMAGIPVVNVHGVDGQRQQDVQGARQMSVDMMDVSGLSLTNQGNERQPGGAGGDDVSMREKMEAAQLQVRGCASLPSPHVKRLLIHFCRHSKHRRQRSTQRSRPALRR